MTAFFSTNLLTAFYFAASFSNRMAGFQISLLHILRNDVALQATITSSKFRDLRVFQGLGLLLLKDELRQYIFLLCMAMYAPMHVMCLPDKKKPDIDKFKYYAM